MNDFIESLSRLYNKNIIKIDQLEKLLNSNKITKEDFKYITSRKG